jgi:protocatechuate 3,4-dioxygenase beta subunit
MRAIDEHTITEAAIEQMAATPDPRLREIMAGLTRHLHEFAREVDLTPEEWLEGIKFLTAVGQKCTPYRQEFILLSDTLGMSSLVNALHDRRPSEAGTKSSLLGPFYRQDSPLLKLGDSIAARPTSGQEVCLYGRVLNAAGQGVPNSMVQVWQPDETGNYDLQKQDPSEMDLRGTFRTDDGGRFYLRTIVPAGYMIPMDGPVGDMIRAQKRHGHRPAHIHFIIDAPGYREVVTARFGHRVRRHGITCHRCARRRFVFTHPEPPEHRIQFPATGRGRFQFGTRRRRSVADCGESGQLINRVWRRCRVRPVYAGT